MYEMLVEKLRLNCAARELWLPLVPQYAEQINLLKEAADAIENLQTLSDEQSRIISEMGAKYQEAVNAIGELEKDKDFLNFLWNTIQPNEMEQYISMYRALDVPKEPPKEET